MRRLVVTLSAAAAILVGTQLPAQAALLTDLTGTTTLTSGDKVFSDFTCTFISTGTVLGGCSTVNVTAGTDAFGNFGINLQLGASANAGGDFGDYTITYNVTSLAGATITDIHMLFNGAVSGQGTTEVTETVFSGATPVGNINVHNPPPVLTAAANVTGGPYATLSVLKDIQFGVPVGTEGTASISNIGQYVSQIPEPATMALFGLGAMGAAMRRRRHSATR
jgi:hypothetical protein